jgi:zeaxanthin glucosyltransferase
MKIGFLSLPLTGHLNPMSVLARNLQLRENDVVFFGISDVETSIRAAGLSFVRICEEEYPAGSVLKIFDALSKLRGLEAFKYISQELTAKLTQAAYQDLPKKLTEYGVEAVVIDTGHRFLELVPMLLRIPYVQIWNILPSDSSGKTPPYFFSWPLDYSAEGYARNLQGFKELSGSLAPIAAAAKAFAEENGLQIDWNDSSATVSKLAVIAQTPKEFDFPDIPRPPQFHYVGPFHDDRARTITSFPWERLTDAPLIYASLGTLVNGLDWLYKMILEMVGNLPDLQLVLSIGKHIDRSDLAPLPSNAIVVETAPQIELLKRAALCITHAGLNTALEALGQGVPMIGIPIAFDQPGVAARIAYHGVGEFIEIESLTLEVLAELVQTVMKSAKYRDNAEFFKKRIAEVRGVAVAADLIEQVFTDELQ